MAGLYARDEFDIGWSARLLTVDAADSAEPMTLHDLKLREMRDFERYRAARLDSEVAHLRSEGKSEEFIAGYLEGRK